MTQSLIKLKPEIKTLWLEALRSGEYQQGPIHLHKVSSGDAPDQFCCLGVLCDVALKNDLPLSVGGTLRKFYDGNDAALPNSVFNWAFETPIPEELAVNGNWRFAQFTTRRSDSLAEKVEGYMDLTEMNDSGRFSFDRIADFIEEHL